jgi:putative ABC transport system permease protein
VFLFTLAAGILVLLAAVQVSRDERSAEIAVLRTLGARQRFVFTGLLTEFAVLGLTAGVLAASVATVTGYALATGLFDLPWQFNPWLWLFGTVGGTVFVTLAGMLATRPLLKAPPIQVLQSRFA